MKILKFEGRQINEIEPELLDAKENGKDVIYVEKDLSDSYKTPVYLSIINEIEKGNYRGTRATLMSTRVIWIGSKISQDFNGAAELDNEYLNQVRKDDFLVVGYRALLQEKFRKIGEKCKAGKSPIRTEYFISG